MGNLKSKFAGDELRLWRLRLRLRQRDLAAMVGVPAQRVSDWEMGVRVPTSDQFAKLTDKMAELIAPLIDTTDGPVATRPQDGRA